MSLEDIDLTEDHILSGLDADKHFEGSDISDFSLAFPISLLMKAMKLPTLFSPYKNEPKGYIGRDYNSFRSHEGFPVCFMDEEEDRWRNLCPRCGKPHGVFDFTHGVCSDCDSILSAGDRDSPLVSFNLGHEDRWIHDSNNRPFLEDYRILHTEKDLER